MRTAKEFTLIDPNVTVTSIGCNAYSILGLTFQNSKGATNVPQTTITTSSLNGIPFGAPTGFANTTVTGGTYTESQTITLSNASGGTWRVAYNGEVSAPLAPTITAAQLKSTLDGFNGINNVTVTGSSGSFTCIATVRTPQFLFRATVRNPRR